MPLDATFCELLGVEVRAVVGEDLEDGHVV